MHSWRSGADVVSINGADLHVEQAGSGDDVLLVHSGITDCGMWDGQFDAFAGQYRVTRYDMRGFGWSSAISGPYSHVNDLAQVIDTLGLDHPRIVAASLGGRVAIDLAIREPDVFDRLLLVGPAVGGTRFEDPALRACWDQMSTAWDSGDVEKVIDVETRFWINGPGRPKGGADETVIERVCEMQRRIIELTPVGEDDPEMDEAFSAVERLSELSIPVLVVGGEHDVSDIHRNADAIRTSAPDARTVTLPGTGHLPNMESVEEFNRIALDFLT